MKKFIFTLLLIAPAMCFAQNWETVQPTVKTEKKTEQTGTRKLTKAEKKALKYEEDKPYLTGAVPEVNGEVVYNINLDLPGKSAQEIYDRTYSFLQELAKGENSLDGSKIALVDKESKIIVAQYEEWLVFTKKILELDRSLFNYVVEANCTNGKLAMKISRLRYAYEIDRKNGFRSHAEGFITDNVMISKDGTHLNKANAKFRRKTVDRMNEIATLLREAMK